MIDETLVSLVFLIRQRTAPYSGRLNAVESGPSTNIIVPSGQRHSTRSACMCGAFYTSSRGS